MGSLDEIIRRAFSEAKIPPAVAARMINVEEQRFLQLAQGTAIPSPSELEAVAQAFGTSVHDFQTGDAAASPLRELFFRSESEGGGLARDLMIELGVHRVMGEFVRCVRDAGELARILDDALPPALPIPPKQLLDLLKDRPPHGGDRLAEWFRGEMGLGADPIASLRQVVEGLGIRLFWVTPEVLATSVEGASACDPSPAILVNLVEGPDCWWRTRMTLGHELCHLLCDRLASAGRFAILSPDERELGGRWRLYDEFESIERRARAFAACLLAPQAAVTRVIGNHDPTSEEAIVRIGQVFGIGRIASINRLATVFRFGKLTRSTLLGRVAQHWYAPDHPDRVVDSIGLRAGVVRQLAERAFRADKVDAFRVREFLSIPLTEPLPSDWRIEDPARLAPLRTVVQRVLGIVEQYVLDEVGPKEPLRSTCCEPSEGGWRVALASISGEARGYVLVSYELDHVEPYLRDVA